MRITKPLLTGMRMVAVFEAAKGAIVLLVGLGVLALIGRDAEVIAERIVRFSHLNPASRYPHIFIDAASRLTDTHLWFLAAAAAAYALVRAIEAYGLWYERRWAEWFALLAGGIYVPVELYELVRRPSWVKAVVLLVNLGIVAYMAYALMHPVEQERELAEAKREREQRKLPPPA
jgi:uncharacterized membrane protein (DUF2068 family)